MLLFYVVSIALRVMCLLEIMLANVGPNACILLRCITLVVAYLHSFTFTRGEAHLTPSPYVCTQLAAKVIGDEALARKFEDSVQTIRRDIMFAASLYI